jgi:hypothetical protein
MMATVGNGIMPPVDCVGVSVSVQHLLVR